MEYTPAASWGENYGTITDCVNSGEASTNESRVGGMAGHNAGEITNCHNADLVTGKTFAGGIAGTNDGTITKSYNTAKVEAEEGNVGGIAGSGVQSSATITDCYNTGRVVGPTSGGIAPSGRAANCYNIGQVDGGGIVASSVAGMVTNCYYLEGTAGARNSFGVMKTANEFAVGEVTWLLQDNDNRANQVWGQQIRTESATDPYPLLTDDNDVRVWRVRFINDNTPLQTNYVNSEEKVIPPGEADDTDAYEFIRWAQDDVNGDTFTAEIPVTRDIDVYSVGREKYGQESAMTVTAVYGDTTTVSSDELDACMGYKGGTSTTGNFTYTVGDNELNATISGGTLTIPANANVGRYTLTITAKEKEPQYSTYAVGDYDTTDVEFVISVIINKAIPTVTPPEPIEGLEYTGEAQELVKAGTTTGGEMQYRLDDGDWGTAIPRAADIGDYTVYYRVVGGNNYEDVEDDGTQYVTVTISSKIYTITCDPGQYGIGEAHTVKKTQLQSITLPGAIFTRKGYTQTGWSKTADGLELAYDLNAVYNVDEDVTLYPYWKDDIAPVIGELTYENRAANLWDLIIGKRNLIISVPVIEDGSGVEEIRYAMKPASGGTTVKTTTVSDNMAKISFDGDFSGSITIDCKDLADNPADSVTVGTDGRGVIVEDNAPKITYTVKGAEVSPDYYDTKPDVTVTVTDDENGDDSIISAGIASASYQVGNSAAVTVDHNYTTGAGPVLTDSFTIEGTVFITGRNGITVTVTDNAGNTAQAYVDVYVAGKEETPAPKVDRENGSLTGLEPGGKYTVDGKERTADENGNIPIEDDWTGRDVEVVKKGDGTATQDSDPATVTIPSKEKKPDPKGVDTSGPGKSDGKITNLEPDETYEVSRDGGKTWETVTADSEGNITGFPAGDYQIRTKAKDDTISSEPADCRIGEKKPSKKDGGSTGGSDDSGNRPGNDSDDNGGQPNNNSDGNDGQPNSDSRPDNGSKDSGRTGGIPTNSVTPPAETEKSETKRPGTPEEPRNTQEQTAAENINPAAPQQSAKPQTEPEQDVQTNIPEETSVQNVQVQIQDGAITVTGAAVATGTITTAETAATTLTVGEGSVKVIVVSDEYRYAAGVADTVAVANAVLTPEQIQLVNDGESIEIKVEVKDISGQVSQQDKNVIESGLTDNRLTGDIVEREQGELTLGAYIDISMYIRVGDGEWGAVTHTGEPIEVVIGIPDDLLSEGRIFYIARSHEGAFALLDDLDSEPDTITIRTELFSTYAIVFRQMLGTDADASSSGSLASLSWTAGVLWSLGILVMLGIAFFLIFWKRRKDEEAAS